MTTDRTFSVFELTFLLKESIEGVSAGLWVQGEAGRVQLAASGHVYFTLKDTQRDAMMECVMYKREAMRFGKLLVEGEQVRVRGRGSLYAPRGRLQWIADVAQPAGQGALLLAWLKLRQKLSDEGLFAPERKRPLPASPRLIGVVTSRSGAAFQDICKVARRRGRVNILLSPALVQGEGAVQSLLAALDRLELVEGLDVVILGRGGGAQEDLAAFQDERLVRRIASFRVPVVSAVGHETDLTLSDLASDRRAATPSEAAELVVPSDAERREQVHVYSARLVRAIRSQVEGMNLRLARVEKGLGDPRFLLVDRAQEHDEWRARLQRSVPERLAKRQLHLGRLKERLILRHPRAVMESSRSRFTQLKERIQFAINKRVMRERAELGLRAQSLDALSPLAVLGRGYAIVKDERSHIVRSVAQLEVGQMVSLEVKDGVAEVRVDSLKAKAPIDAALAECHPMRSPETEA